MTSPRFHFPRAVKTFGIAVGLGAIGGSVFLWSYLQSQGGSSQSAAVNNEGVFFFTMLMLFIGAVAGALVALIPALFLAVLVGSASSKDPTYPKEEAAPSSDVSKG